MNKLLIGGVLALAVALVLFAPEPEDEGAQPVARKARSDVPASARTEAGALAANGASANPANPATAGSLQIKAREEQDFGNLFAGAAPPPAAEPVVARKTKASKVAPAPVGPPQAPPLPFQYMGRWLQEGEVSYFLQLNGRNLVLRVGDTVDQTYKLEQASAGTLSFVYLPLNQKQSMAVGEVN